MNNINAQTNSTGPEQAVFFDITKANAPKSLDSITKESSCVLGKTVSNHSGKQTAGFKRSNTYDFDIEYTKKRKISSDEYQKESTATIKSASYETSCTQINNDFNSNADLYSSKSKVIECEKHTRIDEAYSEDNNIKEKLNSTSFKKEQVIENMDVDIQLPKLSIDIPNKTLLLDGSDEHSKNFNEVVRRINKSQHDFILDKLSNISENQLKEILDCCNKPELIMNEYLDFFKSTNFPYASLKALKDGKINVNEFSTLVSLHGIYLEKIKDNTSFEIKYMNLFDENNKPDERSWDRIKLTLENKYTHSKEPKPDSIFAFNPETIANDMQDKLRSVRPIEKMFWYYRIPYSSEKKTLGDYIRTDIDTNALSKFYKNEMLPSTSMRQALSNSAYKDEAHRINPVIGISSVSDIRLGSLGRFRDFALPFPENPVPNTADGHPAPSIVHFQIHDFYHAMRSGGLKNMYIDMYVAIGDELEKLQRRYNNAVIKIKNHKDTNEKPFNNINELLYSLQKDPSEYNESLSIMATRFQQKQQKQQKQQDKYDATMKIKYLMENNGISYNELETIDSTLPKTTKENKACSSSLLASHNEVETQQKRHNNAIIKIKYIMEANDIPSKYLEKLVNTIPKILRKKEMDVKKTNNYGEMTEIIPWLRRQRAATGKFKFNMYDCEMLCSKDNTNNKLPEYYFHLYNISSYLPVINISQVKDNQIIKNIWYNLTAHAFKPLFSHPPFSYELHMKILDDVLENSLEIEKTHRKQIEGSINGIKKLSKYMKFIDHKLPALP